MKTRIIVSACLLGENCKYNGGNNLCKEVVALKKCFELVPVCPEYFGNLPIPRVPCEIVNGRVISRDGEDLTDNFVQGAEHTLYIAKECNAPAAILKERSPSCGYKNIYDGTFSGVLTNGNGVTADLLNRNEIMIFGESELKKLIELYL